MNNLSNLDLASDPSNGAVSLSPEQVRMTQKRASGRAFNDELARLVVENLVYSLDPELDILIDESAAMCNSANLCASVGVSDVVVNGHRIDVRALDAEGKVSIDRALIGSQYLSLGTMVVDLTNDMQFKGQVLGFIGAGVWMKTEEACRASQDDRVAYAFSELKPEGSFDFASCLVELLAKPIVKLPQTSRLADPKADIQELLNGSEKLISARRKQIFSYICSSWSEQTCAMLDEFRILSARQLKQVLQDASIWNERVEKIVDRLKVRFERLSREDLRLLVERTGATCGGQIASPYFKSTLLNEALALELKGKTVPARANQLIEKIIKGVSSIEAVKQLVSNQVAVDLASVIKKSRGEVVQGFVSASVEEIGMAFQQLSLKPAYATHSSSESGVDAINEALGLLEVANLAESTKDLVADLEVLD